MKAIDLYVKTNIKVSNNIYLMTLKGNINELILPGQFCELKIKNHYLRRPFAIVNSSKDSISILYKVIGEGTQLLSQYNTDEIINVLLPLGNSYPIIKENKDIILISGGIGLASILSLAYYLKENNVKFHMILGFNEIEEIPFIDKLKELDSNLEIALYNNNNQTPIDLIQNKDMSNSIIYACGPLSLLKKINEKYQGFISLEARMGCGYGVCNGCVIKNKNDETLSICKDGPIFKTKEIIL